MLALGFEQMKPGALGTVFDDRPSPFEDFDREAEALVGMPDLPLALRYFGGAGLSAHEEVRHAARGLRAGAREGEPTRRAQPARAAAQGAHGRRRDERADAVARRADAADGLPADLRRGCGGARLRGVRADDIGLRTDVFIAAQAMTTDRPDSFDSHDMMQLVGYGMSKAAAQQVYEQAGIGPRDLDVVELHDCFAQNELITYEALGLCREGERSRIHRRRRQHLWRQGRSPIRPAGLLSKGHPLGATGLAQCFELTHQLRGSAEQRQVDGARIALQHNLGLGGACVVTLYQAA